MGEKIKIRKDVEVEAELKINIHRNFEITVEYDKDDISSDDENKSAEELFDMNYMSDDFVEKAKLEFKKEFEDGDIGDQYGLCSSNMGDDFELGEMTGNVVE